MAQSRIQIPLTLKEKYCPRCFCGGEEDNSIQGDKRSFSQDELEPLTTYFHNALHVQNKIDGTKIAIDFYDRSITFNELSVISTALAMQLVEKVIIDETNTHPGADVVFAVCLPISEKIIPVIFGILKTGACYLPLDPQYPEEVLLSIINKFGPRVLITDESGPILCKYNPEDFTHTCKIYSVEDLWLGMTLPSDFAGVHLQKNKKPSLFLKSPTSYSFILKDKPHTKERLAVVIQNSKLISSHPQGVRITHLNIMNRIIFTWEKLPYAKNGACCLSVPISSPDSISQIFAPLLKGVTLHLLSKRDTKMMRNYIEVIGQKCITRICLSQVVFQDFINECSTFNRGELNKILRYLKYVICRGQLISKEVVSQFSLVFPKGKSLISLYGHPELTGDVICEKYKGYDDLSDKSLLGRILLGQAIYNTKIYVLDSKLKQLPIGEQGQVCVAGIPVALGYIDKPTDLGIFAENPYIDDNDPTYDHLFCTGDYGRLIKCRDRKLRLLIEGRKDDLLHHKGYDFNLDDIKHTLMRIEEIENVHVVALHPGNYDQTVVAFVVLKPQCKESTLLGEIDFQLRTKLPELMIPEIKVINEIPTVETGRIATSNLLYQYESNRDCGVTDWGQMHLKTSEETLAGQVLLEGLYKFCSIPVEVTMNAMHLTAYELGCTSNNTVCIYMYLVSKGYAISLQDFLGHASLLALIDVMSEKYQEGGATNIEEFSTKSKFLSKFQNIELQHEYSTTPLKDQHKTQAIQLLASCYGEKGDLEKYNLVLYEDYVEFLESLWNEIVKAKLSLCCIRNSDGKIVGVIVSHDFFTDVDSFKLKGGLHHIIEFSHAIKSQFLEEIPHQVNNTLECWLLGTLKSVKPKDNVRIVALLLTSLYQLAVRRNFANIYITTCNQLVEDMSYQMMNYELLDDFIASSYEEHSGFKPFQLAPNTLSVKVLLFNLMTPNASMNTTMNVNNISPANVSIVPATVVPFVRQNVTAAVVMNLDATKNKE